jgi:hypothetical protein
MILNTALRLALCSPGRVPYSTSYGHPVLASGLV